VKVGSSWLYRVGSSVLLAVGTGMGSGMDTGFTSLAPVSIRISGLYRQKAERAEPFPQKLGWRLNMAAP
jgi:hypothetical protein